MKKLSELNINEEAVIYKIENQNKAIENQLKSLGFLEGEKIILLNHNYNKKSYLVKVMGINYAIDAKICEGIIVCER